MWWIIFVCDGDNSSWALCWYLNTTIMFVTKRPHPLHQFSCEFNKMLLRRSQRARLILGQSVKYNWFVIPLLEKSLIVVMKSSPTAVIVSSDEKWTFTLSIFLLVTQQGFIQTLNLTFNNPFSSTRFWLELWNKVEIQSDGCNFL